MWEIKKPQLVKLIVGILASDQRCLDAAVKAVEKKFGKLDLFSQVWPFTHTKYYEEEAGDKILRQFVTVEKLIDPGKLADIKHISNKLEMKLAKRLKSQWPRPVNLDPGIIEPSKLVLATTKNFSHRIYIGKNMYAEVTLSMDRKKWKTFDYTFPDYKDGIYFEFLSIVRNKVVEQQRV